MAYRGPSGSEYLIAEHSKRRESFPSNRVATPKIGEGLLFQPLTCHQTALGRSSGPSYTSQHPWASQGEQRRGSDSSEGRAPSVFPSHYNFTSSKAESAQTWAPSASKDEPGYQPKPFYPGDGLMPKPFVAEKTQSGPVANGAAQPFVPPTLQTQTKIEFMGGGAAHILPQNIIVPVNSLPGMFPGLVVPPVQVPGSSITCNFYSARRPSVTTNAPGMPGLGAFYPS